MSIKVEEKPFGKLKDGSNVRLFRLTNKNGMSVEVSRIKLIYLKVLFNWKHNMKFVKIEYCCRILSILQLINYGATIRSIELKGSDGKTTDVCLGFDTIDGYLG